MQSVDARQYGVDAGLSDVDALHATVDARMHVACRLHADREIRLV